MGFQLDRPTETSCVFRTTRGGDDVREFMACAQVALKNVWLDISIDISENPRAFGAVLLYVLKLQQVLTAHHKSITLRGLKALESPAFVQRMRRDFGIHVLVEPPQSTPPPAPTAGIAQGVITKPKVTAAAVEGSPEKLPSIEEIEMRFKAVRERLAQALKRKRYLEHEQRSYKERIKSLSSGLQEWHIDQRQIKRMTDLETMSAQTRAKAQSLQREIDRLNDEMLQVKSEKAKSVVEAKTSFKKEKEILDKQIAELTKKQEQIRAEYKKKAEARREKLARAQAASQPK
jgi:hypothetical protein